MLLRIQFLMWWKWLVCTDLCYCLEQSAVMFLHKPETAIPVFRPDPEASPFRGYMTTQLPEGLWTTGLCECYRDVPNCNRKRNSYNLSIPFIFFVCKFIFWVVFVLLKVCLQVYVRASPWDAIPRLSIEKKYVSQLLFLSNLGVV